MHKPVPNWNPEVWVGWKDRREPDFVGDAAPNALPNKEAGLEAAEKLNGAVADVVGFNPPKIFAVVLADVVPRLKTDVVAGLAPKLKTFEAEFVVVPNENPLWVWGAPNKGLGVPPNMISNENS